MKLPRFIVLLPLATLLVMLGGCEKEGPAEQAGENLDETVEEIQEKAEDTKDMAMEKVEQAGDEIVTATDSAAQ
jgi:outer membrane lipoprotein-sorting protein